MSGLYDDKEVARLTNVNMPSFLSPFLLPTPSFSPHLFPSSLPSLLLLFVSPYLPPSLFFSAFKTQLCYVPQAGLKLKAIFLLQALSAMVIVVNY